MKKVNWIVGKSDARPNGKPDECFYCQVKMGGEHAEGCVIRRKSVLIDYTVSLLITVPEDWDESQVNFHYNDGTWCGNNITNLIEVEQNRLEAAGSCQCRHYSIKFVRDATPEDDANHCFSADNFDRED